MTGMKAQFRLREKRNCDGDDRCTFIPRDDSRPPGIYDNTSIKRRRRQTIKSKLFRVEKAVNVINAGCVAK